MSLFIAARPDDGAAEDLQDELDRVRRLPVSRPLRWQPPGLWHVTLAFLGDPPDDADDVVAERIEGLCTHDVISGVRIAGSGCTVWFPWKFKPINAGTAEPDFSFRFGA